MTVPCKDCSDRNARCHAECEKYKLWNEKHLKQKAEERKNIEATTRYCEYIREAAQRIKNGYKRKG